MKLLLFNKPYRVMSQFSAEGDKTTLAEFIDIKDVYPAGRLDFDSEGLMVLTDDGKLQAKITSPDSKKYKTYLVQVEGEPDRKALIKLQRGVELKEGRTLPARAKKIAEPEQLWDRNPPIRFRKDSPTSWLEIQIREGKNRQVRRMTAAVGYPALRLIRSKIDDWDLQGLKPGEYRLIEE
ncbi:MAG: pseudouridine synthase [Gammaproteobacteria bacterium]|jgi:23S rRNA pseudouridine2457 synthase|nr:pseudouridine synthase [Gammaproteobacteria bacterium]MBT3723350.1 pseudouridine synthase [Gammaproteobacteria bacterium]MBT4077597.1 pseudouridine synthase [Gammaproteobacteria bacterium]MBT4194186.1 pseudouridine synthase [Gammaproteobacteria bacterium]MBT4449383.1 pseudouridine synthase [Gammaproteobacteria bacterium]